MLDLNAQPHPAFNAKLRMDRAVHELLGIVKGMLFDGVVTEEETIALQQWVSANPDVRGEWPISVLGPRLNRIFEDFRVSEAERLDLANLLRRIVGDGYGVAAAKNLSTQLPLDEPQPPLTFTGQVYVLTGQFAYAPRKVCESTITRLGGACESGVTRRTNYLVLGTFASRDWIQTSFGRKILKAVEYREKGCSISIVSEDHWAAHLN